MRCPQCGATGRIITLPGLAVGKCGHQWEVLPPAVKRAFAACKTLATVAEHYLTGTQGRWLGVPNDDDVLRQVKGARRAIARAEGTEAERPEGSKP